MRYVSTRATSTNLAPLSFEDVLLAGLAPDGGLYVPDQWPHFSEAEIRAMRGLSYSDIAARVMAPFLGGCFPAAELSPLLGDAYAGFAHKAVAPLKQLGPQDWLLELFHGPTLSFKDYALQVVGRMFDTVLARRGRRVTIVGATSGDTGSAAIEACRDRDHIDIFILYPHGRTSEVQRRQMTTVTAPNVHTLAVDGTFDDCQDLVKGLFADVAFREDYGLSAVNSINWARIVAQIVYYFASATALGAPDIAVSFTVPTGNFGNIFAAYAARKMGLPIHALTIGTNRNDILYRFIQTGEMRIAAVEPSLSPSMDIQVSSNFERLLFEVMGRDGTAMADIMTRFRSERLMPVAPPTLAAVRALFHAYRVDDTATADTIRAVYRETGELIDPHSAVAVAASRAHIDKPEIPRVALACAHAAKFPDAVERATGIRPPLPRFMADLLERKERINLMANDLAAVRGFIASHSQHRQTQTQAAR